MTNTNAAIDQSIDNIKYRSENRHKMYVNVTKVEATNYKGIPRVIIKYGRGMVLSITDL